MNDIASSVSSRQVQANGQKFHILETGNVSKPLILFLHGFPSYSGMWNRYLMAFGDAFHAVGIDLRGYNLSSKPTSVADYRVHLLVQDIVSIVAALGHKQAYIVAHDWGGIIAWHAAAKHPEVFIRAVIMNAPHPKVYAPLYAQDPDQKRRAAYARLLMCPGAAWFLARLNYYTLRKGVFEGSHKEYSQDERREYLAAWQRGLSHPVAYYKANFAHMNRGFTDILPSQVPTLLLWGENDAYLSLKNLENLSPWVKNLEIRRYPNVTHWLPHEQYQELLSAIRGFFA